MTDEFEAIAELSAAAAAELAATALAASGKTGQACANCATPLIGPYCAACGQEYDTHRHSVWRLLGDTVAHIVRLDSRLMRTMFALLLVPGELPRAFKEGRPQRYVPATRLYIFVSLLFFIILSVTGIAIMQFEVAVQNPAPTAQAEPGVDIFTVKPSAPAPATAPTPAPSSAPALAPAPSPASALAPAPETAAAPPPILTPEEKAREHAIAEAVREAKAAGVELDPKTLKAKNAPSVSSKVHFFAPFGSVKSTLPAGFGEKVAKLRADAAKSEMDPISHWMADKVLQGIQHLTENPAALNGPLTAWIPRVLFLLLPLFALLLALFYWRQRKHFYFVDHLVFSLNVHTFAFFVLIVAALSVQAVSAQIVGFGTLAAVLLYFFIAMKRFYGQGFFWTGAKFVAVSFLYTVFFLMPALAGVLLASMVEA